MSKLAIEGGSKVRTTGFAQWPIFGELEKQIVLEVLESGKWGGVGEGRTPGYIKKIPEFEQKFSQLQDAAHGVTVVNGTVAITVALQTAGIQPGDEVIVPPYTFIATATAALAYGVIPVFVDIEEDTFLIDPEKIEQAITPRTKGIIAVHIAGTPANMTRLTEIAKKHQLALIEDSAQAVGATWEGRKVGAIGDMGTFSFQSSKNLNAGEGGIITTNDKHLWEKAWSIINVGRIPSGAWYQHEVIGQNYRITEFQAALLLAQMTRLEEQMQLRESNVALLNELLAEVEGLQLLRVDPRVTRSANHLYMFKLSPEFAEKINKNDFISKMNAEGIPVAYGYHPLNQNQAIQESIIAWSGQKRVDSCPVCERICEKQALWLPQNVLLSDEQAMHDIQTALKKVIASYS